MNYEREGDYYEEWFVDTQLEYSLPNGSTLSLAPQTGPKGCIPACLANADRFLSGSSTTFAEVDQELGRGIEDDVVPPRDLLWLLNHGFRVQNIQHDPTGFREYLAGTMSYEILMQNIARHEFGGSLEHAYATWGTQEVLEHWEAQKSRWRETQESLRPFKERGQYSKTERTPSFEDILRATQQQKVALIGIDVGGRSIVHELLCLPSQKSGCVDVFCPQEDWNSSYEPDCSPQDYLLSKIVYNYGVTIISRYEG